MSVHYLSAIVTQIQRASILKERFSAPVILDLLELFAKVSRRSYDIDLYKKVDVSRFVT
jgi:hypothetical protein